MGRIGQPVQPVEDQLGVVAQGFFRDFLKTFSLHPEPASPTRTELETGLESQLTQAVPHYATVIRGMMDEGETTLYVDMEHLKHYDGTLSDGIQRDFYQLEPHLRRGLRDVVEEMDASYLHTEAGVEKELFVCFYNVDTVSGMRELKADTIGRLCAFRGTVTRTSDVRPELFVGCFRCLDCQTVIKRVPQQFCLTYPSVCSNTACTNRTKWQSLLDQGTFVDWQKVRVQESPDEVPPGSLPRTLDVILRNASVEKARAGDKCLFTGTLLAVPDINMIAPPGERVMAMRGASTSGTGAMEGIRGIKHLGTRELTYRLCFLASAVQTEVSAAGTVGSVNGGDDMDHEAVRASLADQERDNIERMRNDPDVVRRLAQSMAPAVYGHLDVKKAVLLMLMGGVHKQTLEGINLRGDINVLIVGDPSCAKSQVLKYVASFMPRAVYTSGKSSSAAGLTATVAKDEDSGEFCIEAGALMLADNGVCCIDEFDKMDVRDQVAIHECMEQQSISIAKAGIQATLNARTSILAAANPVGGRYDRRKPLRSNIMLPAPIMSRFDLVHVMLDEPDDTTDFRIASHIVRLHQLRESAVDVPYTKPQLQNYIRFMRTVYPVFSLEARQLLTASYVALRSEDSGAQGVSTAYKVTVRQLEAMVRLSEALARAYGKEVVTPAHVREARRLLKNSILHVESRDIAVEGEEFEAAVDESMAAADLALQDASVLADATNGLASQVRATQGELGDVKAMEADGAHSQGGAEQAATEKEPRAEGRKSKASGSNVRVLASDKFRKYKQLVLERMAEEDRKQEAREDERSAPAGTHEAPVGLSQEQLQSWFATYVIDHNLVRSKQELLEELKHLRAVIRHMVEREGTLAVLQEPEREPGEEDHEYRQRVVSKRVLGLGSNYALD